ncbi:MAG: YihY/virulence factor BrkB family protein [Bryobacteraceae bacterium]
MARIVAPDQTHILEPGGTEVTTSAGGARRHRKPLRSFRLRDIKFLLAESFSAWNRHNAPRLGAALAFYALFSLTPLLLLVVGIGGLVFGQKAAESQIVWQVADLAGPTGASAIEAILQGTRNTAHSLLASIVGFATLLLGASAVFVELRDALNTIWEVCAAQTSGLTSIVYIVRERLFSFGLVLAIGFLLLVSLAVSALLAALGKYSASFIALPDTILLIVNGLISFTVITGLFAAIYKVIPEVRIEWRDVLFGAAVTSILFTLGKLGIGMYLGRAGFASTYGAAASVVVFIFWIYYSSQVFFLGAEFTKAFANRYGSRPSHHPEGMVVEGAGGSQSQGTGSKVILA